MQDIALKHTTEKGKNRKNNKKTRNLKQKKKIIKKNNGKQRTTYRPM